MTNDNRLDVVWSPAEQGEITDQYVQELQKVKDETGFAGVPMCIPTLDDVLKVGHRGTIRVWQGRPGHGKSSMMLAHARNWANVIKRTSRQACVVYATAETMVEHLNIMLSAQFVNASAADIIDLNLNDEQKRKLDKWNYAERGGFPIFAIGKAFKDKSGRNVPLSPRFIGEAVQAIKEHYSFPELVMVDYLQILKSDDPTRIKDNDTKTTLIGQNMSALKQWAQDTKTFWSVGVQAGRQVDDQDPPFPGQGDGQWASSIEQETDSGCSITRPIKYLEMGTHAKLKALLEKKGMAVDLITEAGKEALGQIGIVTVWKQRFGQVANKIIRFDPRWVETADFEAKYAINDRY